MNSLGRRRGEGRYWKQALTRPKDVGGKVWAFRIRVGGRYDSGRMFDTPGVGTWGEDLDVPIGHELELFWISDHRLADNTYFDAHFKVEIRPAGCGGSGTDAVYGLKTNDATLDTAESTHPREPGMRIEH